MSAVGERPRGPPGPRDAPGGSPAPRRKILVRKVKRPEGSVATSQDGLSTRATSPARSRGDFGALSTLRFESAGPVTGRGGKATRPPPSAPGTPPEPATEAAVAPRGPRPGKRGKREEWTVLGDVGASRGEADPPPPSDANVSKSASLFSPRICDCLCTLAERRLTRVSHSRKPRRVSLPRFDPKPNRSLVPDEYESLLAAKIAEERSKLPVEPEYLPDLPPHLHGKQMQINGGAFLPHYSRAYRDVSRRRDAYAETAHRLREAVSLESETLRASLNEKAHTGWELHCKTRDEAHARALDAWEARRERWDALKRALAIRHDKRPGDLAMERCDEHRRKMEILTHLDMAAPVHEREGGTQWEWRMGLRNNWTCLLYTSPSPRDQRGSRMPSSA